MVNKKTTPKTTLSVPQFQNLIQLKLWLRINHKKQITPAEVEAEKKRLMEVPK